MTEMDDTILQSPEFQFRDGGYSAVIRKHGDAPWDIYDLFDKPLGTLHSRITRLTTLKRTTR